VGRRIFAVLLIVLGLQAIATPAALADYDEYVGSNYGVGSESPSYVAIFQYCVPEVICIPFTQHWHMGNSYDMAYFQHHPQGFLKYVFIRDHFYLDIEFARLNPLITPQGATHAYHFQDGDHNWIVIGVEPEGCAYPTGDFAWCAMSDTFVDHNVYTGYVDVGIGEVWAYDADVTSGDTYDSYVV